VRYLEANVLFTQVSDIPEQGEECTMSILPNQAVQVETMLLKGSLRIARSQVLNATQFNP
jgi:hypothetical protein